DRRRRPPPAGAGRTSPPARRSRGPTRRRPGRRAGTRPGAGPGPAPAGPARRSGRGRWRWPGPRTGRAELRSRRRPAGATTGPAPPRVPLWHGPTAGRRCGRHQLAARIEVEQRVALLLPAGQGDVGPEVGGGGEEGDLGGIADRLLAPGGVE